jgi:hypothetical protein
MIRRAPPAPSFDASDFNPERRGLLASLAFCLVALAALPACVAVAVGAAAAGTVYMLGEDSAEVTLEASRDKVFDATKKQAEKLGAVKEFDRGAGTMTASIEEAEVTTEIKPVSDDEVRLVVKARKNSGVSPAPDVAQKLASEVAKAIGD